MLILVAVAVAWQRKNLTPLKATHIILYMCREASQVKEDVNMTLSVSIGVSISVSVSVNRTKCNYDYAL